MNDFDPRVETLTRFAVQICKQQRTAYYREAMRATRISRRDIGRLLYQVNKDTHHYLGGLLLSSVVVSARDGRPSEEYFDCAVELGKLAPNGDLWTKRTYWEQQVAGLHRFFEQRRDTA